MMSRLWSSFRGKRKTSNTPPEKDTTTEPRKSISRPNSHENENEKKKQQQQQTPRDDMKRHKRNSLVPSISVLSDGRKSGSGSRSGTGTGTGATKAKPLHKLETASPSLGNFDTNGVYIMLYARENNNNNNNNNNNGNTRSSSDASTRTRRSEDATTNSTENTYAYASTPSTYEWGIYLPLQTSEHRPSAPPHRHPSIRRMLSARNPPARSPSTSTSSSSALTRSNSRARSKSRTRPFGRLWRVVESTAAENRNTQRYSVSGGNSGTGTGSGPGPAYPRVKKLSSECVPHDAQLLLACKIGDVPALYRRSFELGVTAMGLPGVIGGELAGAGDGNEVGNGNDDTLGNEASGMSTRGGTGWSLSGRWVEHTLATLKENEYCLRAGDRDVAAVMRAMVEVVRERQGSAGVGGGGA